MVSRSPGQVIKIHDVSKLCVSKVEEDEFSFLWMLKDFTRPTNEIKIESPTFKGGKPYFHEWTVCLNNVAHNLVDYLGVFLCLKKSIKTYPLFTVKARFHASIVDLNGRILKTETSMATEYAPMNPGFGFFNFVPIGDILNPAKNYLVNDGKDLHLFCEVIVENPISHQVIEKEPIPTAKEMERRSLKILSNQMQQLQSEQADLDGYDVDIVSGEGTKFPAFNRILAARSPVFKAMFSSCMKEALTRTITISNFSDEIIRGFLEYIYTARTEVIKSNPMDLMRLADQYEVLGLVSSCENQLATDVTIENAVETFLLARLHSLAWLKSTVISFIKRNEQAVLTTEAFEKTRRENPVAVVEMYTLLHSQF